MFNFPLTSSSQQRKTVRHYKTPIKSNIVGIGCYVWLLPTRLPGNRDCLFKLYIRDREPMAREPDVVLLMAASGSLDMFLARL